MAEKSDGCDTSAGRPRSEADHANVRAIFQQWDPTGHGTLQKEELLSILSDIGITDRELAAMLKTTDACRDQSIHYSDFLRWVFAPASSPESGHQAGVSSQRTEPNASVPDGFGCEVEPEADEIEIENCGDILQAAKEGNVGAVRRLLQKDPPSLEQVDKDGDGPLTYAAVHGHLEVVEALLAAGASVEAKNHNGEGPLHLAAANCHLEVVEALLAAGASVDAKSNSGEQPLHLAAWTCNLEAVQALLAAGASVEAKSDKGATPLHWAADNGQAAVVEQLLAAGAAVDAVDNQGRTPLHDAAKWGHTAVVEQLLVAGAAVDAASSDGRTALHWAAGRGRAAVVEQLLAAGAAVDAADNLGRTALHWAAIDGDAAVVERLLAVGAAVDAVDSDGKTPYDCAKQNDHRQVMGVLDPVFVALLSGRSCRCNSAHETVQDLKEEAERKLGTTIEHLIGPDMQPLTGAMRLEEANILPGNTLTAVIAAIDLPSQPAEDSAAPVQEDPLVVKDVGHGIFLKTNQSIFDAHMLKIDVLDSWSGLKDPSSLEKALPSGHVVLSHLIRLHPEDVTFPLPVEVEMPTCVCAATVWRSSTRGWAPVEDATFGDGRVTVKLDHFCDMAVTGQCHVKAVGFILPQGAAAKVALLHVACGTCQKGLEQLCSDPDVLNCFSRCGPSVALGTYHHKEEIQLHQAGQIMKMKVKFNRMPLVSAPLLAESGHHFSVEIDGDDHRFEDPTPSNAAAGLADVKQFAGAATPNLETSQSAAASQATPSAAAWLGGENGSAATDATADAQQLAPASTALGTSQHSAPATEAMASAVPRPERCHLLLSGRFNSERTMNYMRTVKRRLEERRIPVYMVQAQVGQSFAELTRIGLAHAKGMVAFCTSDYGAYTGAGYETFHELEYAHDNKLQIFPIRLCEEWPPAPQDNPRGTFQNEFVFKNGLVYVDDRQMNNAEGAADQIADCVTSPGGIFSN